MKPINSRLGLSIALFALFPLVAIGEANAAYDRQGTAADVRPADLQITAGVQAPPHRSFDPNAMQTIMTQDFEGAFPAAGWSVYDGTLSDGKENYWDDDDYRSAGGSWAAWPANGGADGLDPQSSTYPYFANAWMTYGPFDLSNAQSANVNFMLWLATEANYDFLFFGSSGTGSSYVGSSWSGNADWDQKTIRWTPSSRHKSGAS